MLKIIDFCMSDRSKNGGEILFKKLDNISIGKFSDSNTIRG